VRTVVPCPDCGAPVPIPLVQIVKGDSADVTTIFCRNCMWTDSDEIFKAGHGRALVVWGGEPFEEDVRVPYRFVQQTQASSLQGVINELTAASGGIIWLEQGTYNSGDLVISGSRSIEIWGCGMERTILTGSLTIENSGNVIKDLWVYANGKSYATKIYKSGAGESRNNFQKVRMGGNSDGTGRAPSGDGPQVGLWLDGAIVTVCDHCLFAFCNTGSGLYVNTTNGTYSTNCNSFRDCTFNGNATYGVLMEQGGDGVSSMLLHEFVGGNMEDNALGEVKTDSIIGLRLQDIDFETTKTIAATLDISGSNIVIDNCHAVVGGAGAVTRFFLLQCGRGLVTRCRVSGNYVNADIGVVLENSLFFEEHNNQWWDPLGTAGNVTVTPRFVNHRGGMLGY